MTPQEPSSSKYLTLSFTNPSTLFMMERINYLGILNTIKEEAKSASPGILPKGKSMNNDIGHTVTNISDITLTPSAVLSFGKRPYFCPTSGAPDKQKI